MLLLKVAILLRHLRAPNEFSQRWLQGLSEAAGGPQA